MVINNSSGCFESSNWKKLVCRFECGWYYDQKTKIRYGFDKLKEKSKGVTIFQHQENVTISNSFRRIMRIPL